MILHHVEQRAEQRHHHHHRREEHQDLPPRLAQRHPQHVRLRQEADELQHAEDAEEAEHADRAQVRRARDERLEEGRHDREEVDDAEEGERVRERPLHGDEAQRVLDGEEAGERELGGAEGAAVLRPVLVHALGEHGRHAGEDRDEQRHVEHLAAERVRLEDHLVQLVAQRLGARAQHPQHGAADDQGAREQRDRERGTGRWVELVEVGGVDHGAAVLAVAALGKLGERRKLGALRRE